MNPTPERRKNLALREAVDQAYRLIEPFFDPANAWNVNFNNGNTNANNKTNTNHVRLVRSGA